MREDHTEDMELNKEMEDIRQVPLEPGSRTAPGRERPVGASYTGGAARPGRGAPGMDEGMGRAARPRCGASGLDEGVGRAARPRSGASGFDGGVGRAARPRSGAPGLDEGMGRAVRPGRGAAQTGSQGYGRSRARGNREAQEVRTRQARTVPAEEEGRRGGPGTAGTRPPKARNQRTSQPPLESAPREVTLRPDDAPGESSPHPAGKVSRGGKKRKGVPFMALLLVLILGVGAGLGGGYYLWGWERPYTIDLKAVEVPEWVKQEFIRKNIFSRPDVSRKRINNIVIHYVANPGSTAKNNRDYFDSLADQDQQKSGTSTSSHFVVGLEGEVIQCIPITEIAYGNAPRNEDTISIEVCHPDETGRFNDVTYESVVNLTAWLCKELKLGSKDVVRHYDINGKLCPKYYVEHEDAWVQFRKDVDAAIKEL
nr:N-acetylmuramoyl-L-alanine amidase [uncultured Lachnoclostridium sp.]